jgi:hypothetical protein
LDEVDLDEEHRSATGPEELLERVKRKLDENEDAAEQQRQARAAKSGANRKAQAAQARKDQAAKEISQSIRDVYRKLASALHPDREPDVDERQRKTLLIQRVNQAYAAGDLLTLLGLQLELEQIDAEHLTNVAPERLVHYTQILREQLADLDAEIAHHTQPFSDMLGIVGRSIDPALIDQYLSDDIVRLREAIKGADADLVAFQDPKKMSTLLKKVSLYADDDYDIDDGIDELAKLLSILEAGAPAPRRKKRRR